LITSPLYPLSSQRHWYETTEIYGWRGEFKREGAAPPLKFFPPLEQMKNRVLYIILFERGIKGVSIEKQSTITRAGDTTKSIDFKGSRW
jgi:hypothetical protein